MLNFFKTLLALIALALPVQAAEINDLDPVDANNVGRWPEGMTFANVNNSARADEGLLARYHKDTNGSLVTTGAANAYAVTTNRTLTSYFAGMRVTAKLNFTNTAAATLSVSGLGAKSITNASIGGLVSGRVYDFVYDGVNFQVMGLSEIPSGTKLVLFQSACPSGWTQDATNNNVALRVVSGTGGTTGGTQPFTTAFASQTPTGTNSGTAITTAQMPLHSHPWRYVGASGGGWASNNTGGIVVDDSGALSTQPEYTGVPSDTAGQQIGGTGGGATHTHTFTGNAINLSVSYLDVIICTRN